MAITDQLALIIDTLDRLNKSKTSTYGLPIEDRVYTISKQLSQLVDSGFGDLPIHICSSDEYDHTTDIPTVTNPEENIFYLVPNLDPNTGDMFVEYVYVNDNWELFGSGGGISGNLDAGDIEFDDETAYSKGSVGYAINDIKELATQHDIYSVVNIANFANVVKGKTLNSSTSSTSLSIINDDDGCYIRIPVKPSTSYTVSREWGRSFSSWINSNGTWSTNENGIITGELNTASAILIDGTRAITVPTNGGFVITSPEDADYVLLSQQNYKKWAPSASTINDMAVGNFDLIFAESTYPIPNKTKNIFHDDRKTVVIDDLMVNEAYVDSSIIDLNSFGSSISNSFFVDKLGLEVGSLTNQYETDYTYLTRYVTSSFVSFNRDILIAFPNSVSKNLYWYVKNNDGTYSNSTKWVKYCSFKAGTKFKIIFRNSTEVELENTVFSKHEFFADAIIRIASDLYDIPEYYFEESSDNIWPGIDAKIDSINAKMAENSNCLAFIFFTDPHFSKNRKHSKELIKYIMDKTAISFVICGGDIADIGNGKSVLAEEIKAYKEYKDRIGEDIFYTIRGNHDCYQSYNAATYLSAQAVIDSGSFILTETVIKTITSDFNYHYAIQFNSTSNVDGNTLTVTSITLNYKDGTSKVITDNSVINANYIESDDNTILSSIVFEGSYSGGSSAPTEENVKSLFLSIGSYYKEELIDKMMWSNMKEDPTGGIYTIEDSNTNSIILMLNTNDKLGGASLKKTIELSSKQVEWIKTMLEDNVDKKVIVISHVPFDTSFNGKRYKIQAGQYVYNTTWNNAITGSNVNSVVNALKAFNADNTITGKVVCHISGHGHLDIDNADDSTVGRILSIMTTTDALKGEGWFTNDASAPSTFPISDAETYNIRQIEGGTSGTYSEQAFDVFVFNFNTNKLDVIRIGRGEDRVYDI